MNTKGAINMMSQIGWLSSCSLFIMVMPKNAIGMMTIDETI